MTLFKTRRFFPLFVTQFMGALNDNILKNALVVMIAYQAMTTLGMAPHLMVTFAAGLFILPFFLFSATAGQLADKYPRDKLTRIIKVVEIGLMGLAAVGFLMNHAGFLLAVLFGMGVHSSFFGPIKYALLPQHLHEDELLSGNAAVEAGTFLAILIGTILGGVLIMLPVGNVIVALVLILVAVTGYIASRSIPFAAAPDPALRINKNIAQETVRLIGYARENPRVYFAILGISWFWFVGATFLAQFPTYAKEVLHAEASIVTLLLSVFSIGIGIGSFLCTKMLRGRVQSTFVPLAALGMTIFAADLAFASFQFLEITGDILVSFGEFFSHWASIRIVLDLLLLAVCGGIYIVPLYAIMQHDSDPIHRARVIASNNILNALFMVASAVITALLLAAGWSIPGIFMGMAIASLFVSIYICKLLPSQLLRSVVRAVFKLLFRVKIEGLEHFHAAGPRVLIVANHTSFLDAALIAAYLPEKITFAINTQIARKWWLKPLLQMVDALPLDPLNPLATKTLIEAVKSGKKCMIFPEGRLTVTGSLMKIYEGPALIADRADAVILPIRINGAQYSIFSRLKGKVKRRLFPQISMTILPPHDFIVPEGLTGRARRRQASAALYDIMSEMMFESSGYRATLFSALLDAKDIHGASHLIAEDIERKPVNYARFVMGSFALGSALARQAPNKTPLALLLPNSVATIVTFFALQAYGRVTAMLNFTAGSSALISALEISGVKTIITSRRFIDLARLTPVIDALQEQEGITILYLEDLRKKMNLKDKVIGMIGRLFPRLTYRITGNNDPDVPAVILFTSGSEGTPKGVVLSHVNIQANRLQLAARVDFGPQDKVFNCLPVFHAFGLTGGTLLPLLSGIRIFFYPSPLHYRIVPELIYDTNSIRYVFAGAEKLREETRRAFSDKFGVRIFEGYGATETAPVLSTNTPMQNKPGSVGRFLPAIRYRLETLPGIDEGGKLLVKGPNVMKGYFLASQPGMLHPPEDGWYDTGDIVNLDEDGYIFIKGRVKRFAKIAGEMISLGKVEETLAEPCGRGQCT